MKETLPRLRFARGRCVGTTWCTRRVCRSRTGHTDRCLRFCRCFITPLSDTPTPSPSGSPRRGAMHRHCTFIALLTAPEGCARRRYELFAKTDALFIEAVFRLLSVLCLSEDSDP